MNGCCILEHQRKRKTPLIMQGILEKDLKLPRYVQREILNGRGLAIRYEISEIYLKRSVFSSNSYYDALSTYLHEMCHVFGGDSSNAFSQSLTFSMEILLINSIIIEDYRQKWMIIFENVPLHC